VYLSGVGKSAHEIAIELGRTENAIRAKLKEVREGRYDKLTSSDLSKAAEAVAHKAPHKPQEAPKPTKPDAPCDCTTNVALSLLVGVILGAVLTIVSMGA